MLQPKCRQPFIHNGQNIDADIAITPNLPPRPRLPRSPSSVSAKDMEKQQQLSDWYYIKTSTKSPLPLPRSMSQTRANEMTSMQRATDGIYAKNRKFNQKSSRETIYNSCIKRDANCNVAAVDYERLRSQENVDNCMRWHSDKTMLHQMTIGQRQLSTKQLNEHQQQQQQLLQHQQQVNQRQAIHVNRSNERLNDSSASQIYEELIRPAPTTPSSGNGSLVRSQLSRHGEVTSSSFEHVNVSSYMLAPSQSAHEIAIGNEKRFNRSTGNFVVDQRFIEPPLANGIADHSASSLLRQTAAVSQPLQRRRPPPPPPPSTSSSYTANAMVSVFTSQRARDAIVSISVNSWFLLDDKNCIVKREGHFVLGFSFVAARELCAKDKTNEKNVN